MTELLKKYQNMLKPNDWDISINEIETMDTVASTKCVFNDYKAIICIGKELSAEEKEKSLIHELLHLIFRDAYDIFTDTIEDEYIKTYCSRQHERAIEKTAKIIYTITR